MIRVLRSAPLLFAGAILLVLVLNVPAFQRGGYWLSGSLVALGVMPLVATLATRERPASPACRCGG